MTEEQKMRLLEMCADTEKHFGQWPQIMELLALVRDVAASAITDDQLITALYKRAEAAEERARHFARECDKLTGEGNKCTQ